MSNAHNNFYEFGEFRFDPRTKVLWRRDEVLPLPPKATDVLAVLIGDRGGLVERERLIGAVWHDTFVEEGNLNNAISSLRRILGEDGIIQTVPRRGYRFTAEIRQVPENGGEVVIERRSLSHTTITDEEFAEPNELTEGRWALTRRSILLGGIAVIALAALAAWWIRGDGGPSPGEIKTKNLVILPLRSLSSVETEENRALSLGITENLASRLGGLRDVAVRSTATVNRLAASGSDPVAIGSQMGADSVLEGSYQMSGGRIRINVRLLKVPDGLQLWSGSFDEAETDVFRLQDSLAAQAAAQVTDRLTQQQVRQLAARPTENLEAYKSFVRGRHAWSKRTNEALLESVRHFQAAIDADPTFGLAYSGLADAYVVFNDYDIAPPAETYPKAKAAALKALELAPELVEPRITLAYVLASYDWNFSAAEDEYRKAIEMNPNYATARQWYGEMLCALGRFAEAEAEMRRAADLDPLAPVIRSEIAVILYYSGRYDEVIEHYAKLKQDHPAFPTSYLFSAWAYEQKGMPEHAFAEEMQYWEKQNLGNEMTERLRFSFAEGGRTAFLRQLADSFERSRDRLYVREYRMVNLYGRLRDRTKVLEWLRRGVDKRSSNIVKVLVDPNFRFLKDDPEFRELLERMNLPSQRS